MNSPTAAFRYGATAKPEVKINCAKRYKAQLSSFSGGGPDVDRPVVIPLLLGHKMIEPLAPSSTLLSLLASLLGSDTTTPLFFW